jgi:hypothetical protein
MTVPSGSASLFSSLITEIKNFTIEFLYLQVGNCILQVGDCISQAGWVHCLILKFFTLFAGMIC